MYKAIKGLLRKTRKPQKTISAKKAVIYTALIVVSGFLSGYTIKLLDIYTESLGFLQKSKKTIAF